MRRALLTVTAVAGLAIAGCSGSSGGGGGGGRSDAPLRPASDISSSSAAASANEAQLGSEFDLSDDVSVTVSSPAAQSDGESRYLQIAVSLANNAAKLGSTPTIGILCAGSPEIGANLSGGTVTGERDFPARSTMDGTMLLLLPGDSRTGNAQATCDGPAFITVTPWAAVVSDDDKPVQTRIDLPEDLRAQLNEPL